MHCGLYRGIDSGAQKLLASRSRRSVGSWNGGLQRRDVECNYAAQFVCPSLFIAGRLAIRGKIAVQFLSVFAKFRKAADSPFLPETPTVFSCNLTKADDASGKVVWFLYGFKPTQWSVVSRKQILK